MGRVPSDTIQETLSLTIWMSVALKEVLEKAYEFMKQFVIDGVNLLERFLESVGKMVVKNKNK